ncbi:MAG TPA: EAL domain-containing protein [Acidimicrobiia bacterium]|nr:EAL domain-containing protein [Acidimicrobiia bacterium]
MLTNCHIIAEGVETNVQCEAVRRLGIDFGQGFLFGHPEPVERLAVAKEPAARVPPP